MDGKQDALKAEPHVLDALIERQNRDELDAIIRRCDRATNIVLQKVPLNEARRRTATPRRR